jgi:hypothetical protein
MGKRYSGYKLSNSGDTLKLMVPNYNRKVISGWSNYSCMVTSYKMSENKMGYRGSKSVFISNIVKEQRVDGSWHIQYKPMYLRCTLMSGESRYPIKIPSNQLNISSFSTLINKTNLSDSILNLDP